MSRREEISENSSHKDLRENNCASVVPLVLLMQLRACVLREIARAAGEELPSALDCQPDWQRVLLLQLQSNGRGGDEREKEGERRGE